MNKTVEIELNCSDQNNEVIMIRNAVGFLSCKITSDAWQNRPYYNEDAGSFVSDENYSSLKSAFEFAFLNFSGKVIKSLTITNTERIQFSIKPVPTITRNFTQLEIATIIQSIFYYMENIESDYTRKETELYETDNHYTGKPLQHFIDKAVCQAKEDRKNYRQLMRKLDREST